MSVIEHGKWALYTPREAYGKFKGVRGILHAKRESDDKDWYEYIYGPFQEKPAPKFNEDGTPKEEEVIKEYDPPFEARSAKMIAHNFTGLWIVGGAYLDYTRLWPEQALVIEDTGYTGTDPQADYSGKIYNREDKTFTDPPPPPEPLSSLSLEQRVARLEQLLNVKP
jgi:hypothetical protein